jgi:hypothetical protein
VSVTTSSARQSGRVASRPPLAAGPDADPVDDLPSAADWFRQLKTPGADRLNARDLADLRRILAKVTAEELGPIAEILAEELVGAGYRRRQARLVDCFYMWLQIEERRAKLRSRQSCYRAAAKAWNAAGHEPARSAKIYERADAEFRAALKAPAGTGGALARKLRAAARRGAG